MLACVAGEPGIGKTSLLRALGERARARGLQALGGSGAEFERSVPFGVFSDALDDHLATLDRRSLRDLHEDRNRALSGARTLLERLAKRRPLVLMIDDLHWADDASLELVSHLIRRPPRASVLLALAYRPLQLAERAGSAQAGFIARAADELIEPRPLSREDASELVGDRVQGIRLDALWTESGGNPFYLEQLTRSDLGAPAPGRDKALSGVPPAVAGSLASELGRLPDEGRAVCQAAAVVGDPFESRLVAAACAMPEDATLNAIDALARAGIACETGVPGQFGFRHPIVRRAAYDSADSATRLAAHRRTAEALRSRGADPLELAHHVEAAGAPGDSEAAALLTEAGHAASRRAPAIAARWYAAALRLLPATAEPAERIGLLVAMATAQGSAGMLEESRRTLLEVLDTLAPPLEPLRLRILPFLALVGHMLGRHGEATAMLRRALDELGGVQTPEAAQLGIATAIDCLYEPDHQAMREYAAAADRAARACGQPAQVAATAGVCALALYNSGEVAGALEQCERAAERVASLTDGELAGQLEGVFSLAWAAMSLERYGDCLTAADRGLAISRATGQEQLIVPLTIARTVARTWQGELAEASDEADHLTDAARVSGVDQWIAWALTLRGWIAAQVGEIALAAEYGIEACEIAGAQSRPTYFVAHARLHLAETRLAEGRAEECLSDLVAAAGGADLPVCEPPIRSRWYEILTRASLSLGRVEEARDWAARARDAAGDSLIGGRRCEAMLAEAEVLLAEGSDDRAERCALEGARAADGADNRLLGARARLTLARAQAGRDRAGAITLLEAARAEFDSYGALRARDEAVRELRRLGRRVGRGGARGQGSSGAAALSRREREVADLVTDGLSNREIAERLLLSEKTVETHLSAVFRKLGVPGRAAVGTALWHEDGGGAA